MKSLRAAIICASFGFPLAAQAATVSYETKGGTLTANLVATGSAAWGKVNSAKSTALPTGATWTTAPATLTPSKFKGDYALDTCKYACSPFYDGVIGEPADEGADGWKDTPFFAVLDPRGTETPISVALLTFATPQKALSLLWGSPDGKNVVELLLGGKSVGSFWGKDFDWFWKTDPGIYGQPGAGVALLGLKGLTFDSVRFATWSEKGSFEFTNLTATPVPLPPALLALIAALGMLWAGFGRRMNRVQPRIVPGQ